MDQKKILIDGNKSIANRMYAAFLNWGGKRASGRAKINRHRPHQGEEECSRRRAQMHAAAAAGTLTMKQLRIGAVLRPANMGVL